MVEIEDFPQAPLAKACVCYISDEGYLFPSLLSAIQIRENVSRQKADVVMYFIGEPTSKSELFRSIYAKYQIRFVVVSPKTIDSMHIVFARLFIDRFVEPTYQRILYIDGDTQIAGDINPLIDADLPPGTFCAARDPTTLATDTDKRSFPNQAAYFESIGLSANQIRLYCNSGVILFDRASWANICVDSLKLLQEKPRLRFPDQDLINLAANGRCLTMSFKWNFPIFLMNYGFEDIIKPRIYHFMSNPRPWQGPFQPWGRKWHRTYIDLLDKHPDLRPHVNALSPPKYFKYYLQQYYKKVIEGLAWKRSDIREKIAEIEKQSFV
jgi:lipopolysaccharide biosynthesis glycosyltransferase